MELRTLKYFVAVAREESITRAAEKLFLTQPALSRQIKSLEDELGTKLFVRGKFSVILTDNGFKLLKYAEETLLLAHKTKLKFTSEKIRGDVYIGCAESDYMKFVTRAIKNVRENCPDVKIFL